MAAAYVGRCYSTFLKEVATGELPKATKSGLWDRMEIDAYLDGRFSVRDPDELETAELDKRFVG